MNKFIKNIGKLLWGLIIFILLLATLRGFPGNPTAKELSTPEWKQYGPFELSNEGGRYALTYALAEDKTVFFDLNLARFVAPDLAYSEGHYVSIFAPGVSFLAYPGYVLGKYFGYAQVGAFLTVTLFAFGNTLLVYKLVKRLKITTPIAMFSAMAFMFSSPAYVYASSLYQHHISTFLLLCGLFLLSSYDNYLSLIIVWLFCGISISIDYPNLLLLSPLGIWALNKSIAIEKNKNRLNIQINYTKLFTIFVVIVPLIFFFWFNKASYGNPLKISGTVADVKQIDSDGNPVFLQPQSTELNEDQLVGFLLTRHILQGLGVYFASLDRSIPIFAPLLLLGICGIYYISKEKNKNNELEQYVVLSLLINIFTYTMWGDPWGGWAFGARYLTIFYATSAIVLAILLNKYKNRLLYLLVIALFCYGVFVNTLGALTTSTIPPSVEAKYTANQTGHYVDYTYRKSFKYLEDHGVKSFAYYTVGQHLLTPFEYYIFIGGSIAFIGWTLLFIETLKKREEKK